MVLLLAILGMVGYHMFAYIGHYGYDDLEYARIAADYLNGTPDFSNHFSFRFALVFTTALSYAVFGISDFSSALPAMLATMGILTAVYFILRKRGLIQLSLGLLFTLLSHWFIFYSDKLMPDIFVALAVILSVLTVYKFRYGNGKTNPLRYSFLLSATLLFGFMAKGTILLILPWLVYLFAVDMFARENIRFWISTLLSGMGLLALYFVLLFFMTGSLASRFDALSANAYLNSCSYDRQSFSILVERLTTGFSKMGIQTGLYAAYIFVFAGFFARGIRQRLRMHDQDSYFIMTAILMLLSANFMTISPLAYVPMCLDIRHFLFLIPVAAIPASKVISDFMETGKNRFGILIFVACGATCAYFVDNDIYQKLYLPLAILFVVFVFFHLPKKFHWIFILLIAYILGNKPYDMVLYAQQLGYSSQKEFVFKNIFDSPEPAYILTNPVEKRLGEFYGQFKDKKHVFLNYTDYDPDTLDGRKRYLLRNWYTAYLSGLNATNIPVYIQEFDTSQRIAFDPGRKLALFDASTLQNPLRVGKLLLQSTYGYESAEKYWQTNSDLLVSQPVHHGSFAEKSGEYSATFRLPIDSLQRMAGESLYVACQVFTRFEGSTTAEFVASVDDSSGVLLRKAVAANTFQSAFSNWWPVKMEFEIKPEQLGPEATLSIYLYNPDRQAAFTDDFSVEIYGYQPLK